MRAADKLPSPITVSSESRGFLLVFKTLSLSLSHSLNNRVWGVLNNFLLLNAVTILTLFLDEHTSNVIGLPPLSSHFQFGLFFSLASPTSKNS